MPSQSSIHPCKVGSHQRVDCDSRGCQIIRRRSDHCGAWKSAGTFHVLPIMCAFWTASASQAKKRNGRCIKSGLNSILTCSCLSAGAAPPQAPAYDPAPPAGYGNMNTAQQPPMSAPQTGLPAQGSTPSTAQAGASQTKPAKEGYEPVMGYPQVQK